MAQTIDLSVSGPSDVRGIPLEDDDADNEIIDLLKNLAKRQQEASVKKQKQKSDRSTNEILRSLQQENQASLTEMLEVHQNEKQNLREKAMELRQASLKWEAHVEEFEISIRARMEQHLQMLHRFEKTHKEVHGQCRQEFNSDLSNRAYDKSKQSIKNEILAKVNQLEGILQNIQKSTSKENTMQRLMQDLAYYSEMNMS